MIEERDASAEPPAHHGDGPVLRPVPESQPPAPAAAPDRRDFLRWCAALGLSGAALVESRRAFAQQAGGPAPMPDHVLSAGAELAGLDFTPAERDLMAPGVAENRAAIQNLRQVHVDNDVAPALVFTPLLPGVTQLGRARADIRGPFDAPAAATSGGLAGRRQAARRALPAPGRPATPVDLAFTPVHVLSALLERGQVTSRELTELSIDRIRRHDPTLLAVITLTEELALRQADQADREIKAGHRRGPLHGIPYGAKDLLATRGILTTWGAEPYRGQVPRESATVIRKLEEAGAVLVAKTSVGALAWGDVWFGGTTKNPWKLDQGSSGSSAGSSSGVAAGLFPFAIGTETLGSIVSPCTRCGTVGLRPTFGRVSRHGAMALSWSMDKIGPIARSVEDCALVFDAIHGTDGLDVAVHDAPFDWEAAPDPARVRIGYDRAAFAGDRPEKDVDDAVLDSLRRAGFSLQPIDLPEIAVNDMLLILECEAAAAFDELTRTNQDEQLARQVAAAWPNVFRTARLIPAVEYLQANRIRTLYMRQFDAALASIDVWLAPTYAGVSLRATNLTGHPCVVQPTGFRADGTPTSITFMGRLFGEEALLSVSRAYEAATGWLRRRPPGFA